MNAFHIPTAFQIVGLLLLIMPVTTWFILSRQASHAVALWCAGGLLLGVGLLLIGMRAALPVWMSFALANFLMLLGDLMRIHSLRLELAAPWRMSWSLICTVLGIIVFEIIHSGLQDDLLRLQYVALLSLVLYTYTGAMAWRFGRQFGNRSALWICAVYLLMALAMLARVVELSAGMVPPLALVSSPGNAVTVLIAMLASVVSHIAYAGMKLEQEHIKLVKAEHEYAGILRTTKDAFMVMEAGGRVIDVNELCCQMTGFAREELLGMPLPELEMAGEEIPQRLAELRESGFDRFETRLCCKDGRQLDVEISMTYLPDADGQFLLFARDITVRKLFQLELERRVLARTEELATARAEAEAANAIKTRFMSNLSHEMRTPLHGILGYAELGKSRSGQASQQELTGFFDKILESGARMQKLVESLLNLVQEAWNEHAGLAQHDLQRISPDALVSECISLLEKTAESRQQRFVLENRSGIATIQGDASRLRQVLEHLLGNALKYSPEQTTVTVLLQDKTHSYGLGKALSIQVIDQGCGVPEKEMKAIFEPFYESTRTATGAGSTGLGLALCKSVVQRHKGTLSVANHPQGGAVFEILLPVD